jgi:hypothetical protein
MSAKCRTESELGRVLAGDTNYQRFCRMYETDKQPRFAVFKMANGGRHRFLWSFYRVLAWPENESGVCATPVSKVNGAGEEYALGINAILFPNESQLVAVRAPANCTHWRCEFTLSQFAEDPTFLYEIDRRTYDPKWAALHEFVVRVIIRDTLLQSRPRTLLGPDINQ